MKRCLVYSYVLFCLVLASSAGSFAQSQAGSTADGAISQSATASQDPDVSPGKPASFSFRGDAVFVSKYLWRGQVLTDDWSLQPAFTMSSGGFSFNVWGTVDLTAVNEGDSLFLSTNPEAPSGRNSGLKGKFSEVDYTFCYTRAFSKVSVTGGAGIYTFPERSASLPATTELFGGVAIDAPLAPSATLYVDVDETSANGGSNSLYLKLGAAHSVPTNHRVFKSLDLSASLGIANTGWGQYYYGESESGIHDFNLTLTAPVSISEHWSANAFISYSALIGGFRNLQYPDLREVYRGRTGPGSADNIWGGATLSLEF